jgi:AraC-like DNA-binding protein
MLFKFAVSHFLLLKWSHPDEDDRVVRIAGMTLENALGRSITVLTEHFAGDWLICDGRIADDVQPVAQLIDRQTAPDNYTVVYKPDRHEFFELFICVEGQCALQIGQNRHPVHEGDVAIVLPGVLHQEMSQKSPYLGIWFSIDASRCFFHLSGQSENQAFFTLAGSSLQPDAYAHLMQQIGREIKAQKLHASNVVKSCLIQLLIQARRDIALDNQGHVQGQERRWIEQVTADVINYIAHHRDKPVRLEEICQAVSISGNYLNTLFKSVTGQTISQFAAEYKLEQAKRLLGQSKVSIQEIAAKLGYYDQYHFSKAFKKATGQSPSAFRKGDFTSAE